MREHLSEEQVSAVFAPVDKNVLVIAGPGSGKTRVLTYRLAHLIDQGVCPSSIIALTFTNKAAREMKERVYGLVGERSKATFVGTFHSLCYRALKKAGRTFRIADGVKQRQILKGLPSYAGIEDDHDALLMLSRAKRSAIPVDGMMGILYRDYNAVLTESGLLDFDDLIIEAQKLFDGELCDTVRSSVSSILIDEGQDIDEQQYQLIKSLSIGASVFMTGDNMQAIYAWRSGSSKYMKSFVDDFDDVQVLPLTINFRSGASIVELANEIAKGHDSFGKQLKSGLNTRGQAMLRVAKNENDQLMKALSIIRQGIGQNRTVAVLVRTGFQAGPIQGVLKRNRIQFNRRLQSDLNDATIARKFVAFYDCMSNPTPFAVGDALLMVKGVGQKTIEKVLDEYDRTLAGLRKAIEKQTNSVRKKLALVVRLIDLCMETHVSELSPTELVLALAHVFELSNDNPVVKELVDRTRDIDTTDDLAEILSLCGAFDKDVTAPVLVSTIHGVKGLEFDYVVLLNFNDCSIPHARGHSIEEERNLLYVASTRARYGFVAIVNSEYLYGGAVQEVSQFCYEIDSFNKELENARYKSPGGTIV